MNLTRNNLIFLSILLTPGQLLADADALLVDAEQMACVVENIEAYLSTEDDPVFVFLPLCPDAAPSWEEMSEFAENASLISIKETDTDTPLKTVIVLSKMQLECIQQNRGSLVNEVDEPSGAVMVDLSACEGDDEQ